MCRLGRYFLGRMFQDNHTISPPEEISTHNARYLCPTCAALDLHHILSDGVSREEAVLLGPLVDILEKSGRCDFCRLIKAAFQRTWVLEKQAPDVDLTGITCSLFSNECGCLRDPAPPIRERCHRIFILPSDRPQRIYDVMLAAQSGLTLDIQLLEDDAHIFGRNKEVHGRRVEETVSVDIIRRWVSMCDQDHRGVCGTVWWRGEDESLPQTVRMLDVKAMSIVSASQVSRYIALSYLWGGIGTVYQTTQANITRRTTPGGLDISILPSSISDSIHLCLQLDVQYLWVDALCIIQDSMEDKAIQIGVMELIYGSSYFTIFAVGGNNAHAPLPGLFPGTRPVQQHVEVIHGLHLTVPLPTLREVLAQSTWGTRGWTYQELMLSSRRLFFTGQQTYFECGQDIWCEDVAVESKRLPRSYHPLQHTGGGNFTYLRAPPSWARKDYMLGYMTAITQYTQRNLTNDSDAVDAISALTNAMTKGFKLGGGQGVPSKAFRYGLAITDLNQALLWQPTTQLVRRHIPTGSPWPSWSWAGWRGPVQYRDILSGRDVPRPMESLIDIWYICEGGRLVEISVRPIDRAIAYPEEEGMITRYLPPKGNTNIEKNTAASDGTLVFCTTTAEFSVEANNNPAKSTDTHYRALDILTPGISHPVRAGRIALPVSMELSSPLQLIVLSRTNGSIDLYDTDIYGPQYSGCFLYVMAVQQTGAHSTVERLGIGVIFERAWLDARPQEIQVYLG
ncbi:heterokaryon incompatibility protein-domain-containing protein [Collybia nuda]|uniref:Heterokaryon incompatibility protein-domain-containing protein n=1 Tax=Collybia nuda TaxID=64659 RepID=A0A9P6CJE2_9AGAR|nr:heterokaryon incompatibility protein-domain-containing protein [Collybia nuda]